MNNFYFHPRNYEGITPMKGSFYRKFKKKLPKNFKGFYWLCVDYRFNPQEFSEIWKILNKSKLVSDFFLESKRKCLDPYKIIKITDRSEVVKKKVSRKFFFVYSQLRKVGLEVIGIQPLSEWEVFDFYVGNFRKVKVRKIKRKRKEKVFILNYESILKMNRNGIIKLARSERVKLPSKWGMYNAVPICRVTTHVLKNYLAKELKII